MQPTSPGFRPTAVMTKQSAPTTQTSYAIVGTGRRSSVYLRLAYVMPERFCVTGVVARREEAATVVEHDWGVPTYRSVEALLGAAERPDSVVVSVPWPVPADLVRQLVAEGVRMLAETRPAVDLPGYRRYWPTSAPPTWSRSPSSTR